MFIINCIINFIFHITWPGLFFDSWLNLLPQRVKKNVIDEFICLEICSNMSSTAKMSKHPFMDPYCFQKRSTENELGAYWLIQSAWSADKNAIYSSLTPLPRFYSSESIRSLSRIYAFHSVYFVPQHTTHLFTRQRGHSDEIT